MSTTQLAPALLARATGYRLRGRVHFPKDEVGDVWHGSDEDFVVFRKLTLDPAEGQPIEPGATFTVRFHFARLSARANRRLSLIPSPFIAPPSRFSTGNRAARQ